jgi:hypothetical protein
VFYADGDEWFISNGGVGPSTAIDRSSYRVRDPEAWAPANVAAAIAHQRLVDRLN